MGQIFSTPAAKATLEKDFRFARLEGSDNGFGIAKFNEICRDHGYSERVIHMASFLLSDTVDLNKKNLWFSKKISKYSVTDILHTLIELFDNGAKNHQSARTKYTLSKECLTVCSCSIDEYSKKIDGFGMIKEGKFQYHGIVRVNNMVFKGSLKNSINDDNIKNCGLSLFVCFVILITW